MASVRGMLANVSVLVVSAWCTVSTAYAKDDLTSPQYAQCIDKSGGNTSNMIECNAVELKQQDDSLNKFYRALLAKLTPQKAPAASQGPACLGQLSRCKLWLLPGSRRWLSGSSFRQLLYFDDNRGESERDQRPARVGKSWSVNGMTTDMPQLLRIAHDVNGDDLAILDLQRGGLQRIVRLDRDETRQAVDEAITYDPRRLFGKHAREAWSCMTSWSPTIGRNAADLLPPPSA